MSTRKTLHAMLAGLVLAASVLLVLPAAGLAARVYTQTEELRFGEPGSGDGQLSSPQGVAVNEATGDVYIADSGVNSRVEEFSPTGQYIGQFNGGETPNGTFAVGECNGRGLSPEGPGLVAVDNSTGTSEGEIYVTASGQRQCDHTTFAVIDVFSADGKYITQLTGPESEEFTGVGQIVVDGSGDLWVLGATAQEGERQRLFEFSPTGELILRSRAPEEEIDNEAGGLALDASQDIFMFPNGYEGFEFSPSLVPLGKLKSGESGAITGSPANDNIFIATFGSAEYNYREVIEEFEEPGSSVKKTATVRFGTGAGLEQYDEHFQYGLAVNGRDGTVYATQPGTGQVAVFEYLALPAASTGSAGNVRRTSPTLSTASVTGTVNPEGSPVTGCTFEYATSAYYKAHSSYEGSVSCSQELSSLAGSSPLAVSAELPGLTYGETYVYRLVASNGLGPSEGAQQSFIAAVAPTLSAAGPSVSGITRTAVLLSQMVSPEAIATSCWVEYGPTSAYGDRTEEVALGAGDSEVPCPLQLSGLTPGNIYHYRFVATSDGGTSYGPEAVFRTESSTPPVVTTGAAEGVSATEATLTGIVEPQGLQTSYEFELGTGASLDGAKLFGNAGNSGGSETVSVTLRFLVPGTTYRFRLSASNEDGTGYGQEIAFTTPGLSSSPIVQPPTPPQLSLAGIIGLPPEEAVTGMSKAKAKPLTRAQKLVKALKQCARDKAKGEREKCEWQARGKFGARKGNKK